METKPRGRAVFPFYLKPGPDSELLKWVGGHLRKIRGKKSAAAIAKAAKVSTDDIERIEQGTIHQNLGCFRQILHYGYDCRFEAVLAKCFEAFKERFDPKGRRRFDRDYHYSLCPPDKKGDMLTPVLIGGDPESFLWAAPVRELKGQPLSIDLLELAPDRKRKTRGTPENSHDGAEVIHVMHGTIQVHIENTTEGSYTRKLTHGDSIHYISKFTHRIVNDGNSTSALLLIVRLPEFSSAK